MSDAILELKDLKKSYNQNKSNQIDVLLGANLLLKKGEVVALTAPSGAGKSTLLTQTSGPSWVVCMRSIDYTNNCAKGS